MSMRNCKTLCLHGKIDQMSWTVCTCSSPRPCWYYILHCLDYLRVCLWICFHSEYVQYVQSNDNSGPNVWGEDEEWAVWEGITSIPFGDLAWAAVHVSFMSKISMLHKKSDLYTRIKRPGHLKINPEAWWGFCRLFYKRVHMTKI